MNPNKSAERQRSVSSHLPNVSSGYLRLRSELDTHQREKPRLILCSPIKATWLGGAYLAADPAALKTRQVTRQEYLEHGSGWLSKVFAGTTTR